VPLARLCNENFNGVRTRILMKIHLLRGVLAALLDLDLARASRTAGRDLRQEAAAGRQQHEGHSARLRTARAPPFSLSAAAARRADDARTAGHIMIDGNTVRGAGVVPVRRGHRGCVWYPITPSTR